MGRLCITAEFDHVPSFEALRLAVEHRIALPVALAAESGQEGELYLTSEPQSGRFRVNRFRRLPEGQLYPEDLLKMSTAIPQTGEPGVLRLQHILGEDPTLMNYAERALLDLGGRLRTPLTTVERENPLLRLSEAGYRQHVASNYRRFRFGRLFAAPVFILMSMLWLVGVLLVMGMALVLFPFVWLGYFLYTRLHGQNDS
jgi:hypothetical protein